MKYAILDKPSGLIIGAEFHEWAPWFEHSQNRIIQQDKVGETQISTVFLGINHSENWFETMVFFPDPEWPQIWNRYPTLLEALQGHKRALAHYSSHSP